MKARLIKETRDLLPTFGVMLVLIVLPYAFWPAGEFGFWVLGIACVVMAGSSFGNEFQHRTFSLLLSQPIARPVIWRGKMLILGVGMLAILAALGVCRAALAHPAILLGDPQEPVRHTQEGLALVLIPLCAFCGAPFWTLLLRHEIGGMVFAATAPVIIMLGDAVVLDRLGYGSSVAFRPTGIVLLLTYCALVYCLGYARFNRLEVVEGPTRELSLPASLEARVTRPLTALSSRFRGPFASLLKKELRLQQISFLLAGLFVLIALAGTCLGRLHSEWGPNILGGDYIIYVMILPLIAGAVSVAEERGWDLAEWHQTLPPSACKQWSAKMLTTLSTSFALGLVLPTVLFLADEGLLETGGARTPLPPASQILCWVLGQLLLTSLAVYAASFCNSTLRAILAAFAIIIVGCAACYVVADCATIIIAPRLMELRRLSVRPLHAEEQLKIVMPLLLAGGLFFILSPIQWFAWSNFRSVRPSAPRIVVQLLVMLFALGIIGLAVAVALFIMVARH
jgi:hypothetical protein